MEVMIFLDQGGLHSPSAFSSCMLFPVIYMADGSLDGLNINKQRVDDEKPGETVYITRTDGR